VRAQFSAQPCESPSVELLDPREKDLSGASDEFLDLSQSVGRSPAQRESSVV
jgi:hypothetical protein